MPEGYEDFYDYLDLYHAAAEHCVRTYGDDYSLASFHPAHRFGDEPAGSVVNAIHRSPFPTIHVLREASLDRVRDAYDDDTSAITERNALHAKRLGIRYFERYATAQ